jgi:fluoride exporter|tara:strand:+ start:174 stop:548 length:375 start_codon:yes stop_codon:yes gene_type:complete
MSQLIAVGLGGFIGATSRYLLAMLILNNYAKSFPIHTLIINFWGCFLFGYFVNHNFIINSNLPVKEFLLIGILGGFTTFSTFGFEFISLIQKGNQQTAIYYIIISLFLGGLAIILGLYLNRIYS